MRALRLLVIVSGVATSALSGRAGADGALVVGVPEGGLRDGFAYGRAIGGSSQDVRERAFAICREQARQQGFSDTRCNLIEAFKDKCVAVAMDSGERWAGWAVAAHKAAAEQGALGRCREGARGCRLHSIDCDK